MPPPDFGIKGLDHIVLRITDLAASRHFYEDILGCRPEKDQAALGLYQLRAGGSLIDLIPVSEKLGALGGAPPGTEGRNLDHFCLRIDPFEPQSLCAHLNAHGIPVAPADIVSRYGAEGEGPSLYIDDPDGNTVELKGPPGSVTSNQSPVGK